MSTGKLTKCNQCGTITSAESGHCTNCGHKLELDSIGENGLASFAHVFAVIIAFCGMIAAVYFGNEYSKYGDFNWFAFIITVVATIVSCFSYLAIGEVIKLLQTISDKLNS